MITRIDDFYFDSDKLIAFSINASESNNFLSDSLSLSCIDDYQYVLHQIQSIDKANVPISKPCDSDLAIVLTDKCNLNCRYCLSNKTSNNTCSYVTIRTFLSEFISCSVKENIVISLTGGGEPTFNHKLFFDTILIIRQLENQYHKQIKISLTTNGYFDTDVCEFIIKNVDYIMVSFDVLEELQNQNRPSIKQDSYAVVSNNVKLLCNSDIAVVIRSTLFSDNFSKMVDLVNTTFTEFSEADLSIMPVLPEGLASDIIENSCTAHEFVNNFIETRRYAHHKFGKIITSPLIQTHLRSFFCGGVIPVLKRVWLKPDNYLYTCIDFNQAIGHVDNEIRLFDHIHDYLLEFIDNKIRTCTNCIAFRFCKGGCPARHMIYQEKGVFNWSCLVLQYYWERNLRLALKGKSLDCSFIPREYKGQVYYELKLR